ncbi:hypothetical protein HCG49_14895 [Arenibacter sp. 6A1]|uniref:hypothetical protein n=1 Tax=Arenibacter sp. 6A1 TaxID=2720391 RepID=UPI001446CB08|nr:hypothetical protein [Arenibacter sp. 6A1]NKI27849.1 hypothetical protein [Arenibacter sp. 6A1]
MAKNYRQYLFVFVAMILVLISSCSVKSGIKSLAGVPFSTEQNTTKKGNVVFGAHKANCINTETANKEISQSISLDTADSLPEALLVAAFIFVFGNTLYKQQLHPRYSNLKIPGSLPIFLQNQKLIL